MGALAWGFIDIRLLFSNMVTFFKAELELARLHVLYFPLNNLDNIEKMSKTSKGIDGFIVRAAWKKPL